MPDQIEGKTIEEMMEIAEEFYETEESQKAIEILELVLKRDPQYSAAWIQMAFIYGGLEDFQKTAECCAKIIKYDPKDAVAWEIMGRAYLDLGDYEKVVESWERSIKLEPDNIKIKDALLVFKKRLPIKTKVRLPCDKDESCPYEYDQAPERDIEGMPFIDEDPRECPTYGHICPEFMEDVGLTVVDLNIRSIIHCGGVYKRMIKENGKSLEDIPEAAKLLMEKYVELLGKYTPWDDPWYFY